MKAGIIFTLLVGLLLALPMYGESTDQPQNIKKSETDPEIDEVYVAHPELPRITAEGLKKLMDEKGEYVLVDSRDSASYNKGHIKGAINIHYDPSGDPMAREMTLMALPMDKLIIIYCNCEDDEISANMMLELYDLGYDLNMIKIVSRGILRWNELGYPLIATEK